MRSSTSEFAGLSALDLRRYFAPVLDHLRGAHATIGAETHALLAASLPEGRPTIENDEQVYVRDPDGVRVPLADVGYKR